jgi:DNA-binding cell septation regulator SpoVG
MEVINNCVHLWNYVILYEYHIEKNTNNKVTIMDNIITEIQISFIRPVNGLIGFVSFNYNNAFSLGCVAIYTRLEGGYRLAYPNRNSGDKRNVFHPINKEIGERIEKLVTEKIEEITSGSNLSYD